MPRAKTSSIGRIPGPSEARRLDDRPAPKTPKERRAPKNRAQRGDVAAGARRDASSVKGKLSFGSRLSSSPSSLAAAEAVTTAAIVTYDMMGTQRKLPRPGPIVATVGFFSMLGLAAGASETFAPVIVASGWVLAISVLVTGKRGKGIVGLLSRFAQLAAKTGQGGSGQ